MTAMNLVLMLVLTFYHQPAVVDDLPTASDLEAELNKRDARLFALAVVYKQIPSQSDNVKGEYAMREIAVRSPNRFFRRNSHGHSEMDPKDDPFAKSRVLTPDHHFLFSHLNRIVEEQPLPTQGSTPRGPDDEALLHWLCWWPYHDWPPPKKAGREWQFSKLFTTNEYHIREQLEIVDSCRCCVLEVPDVDVIWLDVECPQRIMRRDLYAGADRAVAERLEYGDYREVKAGIWLPHRIHSIQFDAFAHTEELRARVVRSGTFLLSDVRINEDVTNDCFSLPLPPGTVSDVTADGIIKPINAGQAAHVEAIIEWAHRILREDRNITNAGWYYTGTAFLGFVLVIIISTKKQR